jgi:hypothetical protein
VGVWVRVPDLDKAPAPPRLDTPGRCAGNLFRVQGSGFCLGFRVQGSVDTPRLCAGNLHARMRAHARVLARVSDVHTDIRAHSCIRAR